MEIPIFLFVLNIQKKTFHTKPQFGSKCWRKANVDVDLAYFCSFSRNLCDKITSCDSLDVTKIVPAKARQALQKKLPTSVFTLINNVNLIRTVNKKKKKENGVAFSLIIICLIEKDFVVEQKKKSSLILLGFNFYRERSF